MLYWQWDEENYKKELTDALFSYSGYNSVILTTGHTIETHTEKDNQELSERLINENKEYVSCFYDFKSLEELEEYSINDLLIDGLANKINEITNWIKNGSSQTLILTVNVTDSDIGFGYNNSLRKYSTEYVSIALQRDCNDCNNYGFYIKTAYPEIRPGFGKEIEDRFDTEIILNSNKINKYDKIKGLLVSKYGEEENIHIKTYVDKRSYEKNLRLSLSINKDEELVLNLSDCREKILLCSSEKTIRLSENELLELSKNEKYEYTEPEVQKIKQFVKIVSDVKFQKNLLESVKLPNNLETQRVKDVITQEY